MFEQLDHSRRGRLGSNTEWLTWGKTDPLWGVAAVQGKRRGDAAPWQDDDFYELGAGDWTSYWRMWKQYGVNRGACLEIGCGAGRMTQQLARCFGAVHATDVSPQMVEYARGHVDPNVEFHVTDGATVDLPASSVTAAFSTLVFRHFDHVEDATAYFREIYRVLAEGGSVLIELPVHTWPSPNPFFTVAFRLEKSLGNARAAYRRFWLKRGRGKPFFRRRTYDLYWLLDTLGGIGFKDVEVRNVHIAAINDRHWCVLARK